MMKPPAFLMMTVSRIVPEMVWEAVRILKEQVCQPGLTEIRGMRQMLLVESQEEPGRVIWVSTWDRLADWQVFLGSPGYARLLEEMHPYLLCMPEWYWYSVLGELAKRQEQMGG